MKHIHVKILANGHFEYKDKENGGNDAKHIHAKHGEQVHWHFVNREGYTLTFNENTPSKNDSPFAADPIFVPAKNTTQTVVRGTGRKFPYTVTVYNDPTETDDPDIQIDSVLNLSQILVISVAVGLGLGFLFWNLSSKRVNGE